MIFAWVFEIFLILILAYVYPLNIGLGTRDLSLLHFGFYSGIFSIMLMVYDETRKYLMRRGTKDPNKPGWFERNCLT